MRPGNTVEVTKNDVKELGTFVQLANSHVSMDGISMSTLVVVYADDKGNLKTADLKEVRQCKNDLRELIGDIVEEAVEKGVISTETLNRAVNALG